MWRDEAYYRRDAWRGRWDTEGGGVLMNQAPHNIDFLLWYMGPAEEIFGYWANINHPYVEIEDNAVAVIRFRSGALGMLKGSLSMNPERRLHGVTLVGASGATVSLDCWAGPARSMKGSWRRTVGRRQQRHLDDSGWRRPDVAGTMRSSSARATCPTSTPISCATSSARVRESVPPAVTGVEGGAWWPSSRACMSPVELAGR